MNRQHGQLGFSLIELMVTMVIIAILAAVALPLYNAQAMKTRRTDATTALNAAALEMVDCKSQRLTYTGCSPSATTTDGGHYDLSVTVAGGGATFTLAAAPASDSSQSNDSECGTLSLSSTGTRSASGAGTGCWAE